VLVLAGQLDCVLGERLGVELVRRHVDEVTCAVRPLGDEGGPSGGVAQLLRVDVAEDDPLDRTRRMVVLRLPAAGGVAADDGSLDERARLVRE